MKVPSIFIRLSVLVAVSVMLASCSGQAAERPTAAPPVIVEDHHWHGFIFDRMSEDDVLCIPPEVHSDDELVDYALSLSVEEEERLMGCLSYDGQFEIFQIENISLDLTWDENRCLWDGMAVLGRLEAERGLAGPGGESALGSTAVAAYCIREKGFIPGDWERTPENEVRRRAMVCLVEEAGGVEPFLMAALGSGEMAGMLDEAESGEGSCGSLEAGDL